MLVNLARSENPARATLSPELQLAIACGRYSFSAARRDEVRRLASKVDWKSFLRVICRHRIQGLAARALRLANVSPPHEVSERIRAEVTAIATANLRAAYESRRILERFDRSGIPVLFMKGLSLSALAYGDPFLKMSSDIDILIDLDDLEDAATVLREIGYIQMVPSRSNSLLAWHGRRKESVWRSDATNTFVELHTRLSDNRALIPEIGMQSPRQDVPITSAICLPTLNLNDLLAYLCVHGASSAWFRLKWIIDLAALLHRSETDISTFYASAMARGAGRATAQALLLAEEFQRLQIPESIRGEILADRSNRLLARVASSQLRATEEPTTRILGTASIHLSQALLLKGWRFKGSEVARQIADVLTC
jgi:hypothetical protein